jgi:hypothetical protein
MKDRVGIPLNAAACSANTSLLAIRSVSTARLIAIAFAVVAFASATPTSALASSS